MLHRSRVCYLTSLEISLPVLEASSIEWQISHTCASRQIIDNGEPNTFVAFSLTLRTGILTLTCFALNGSFHHGYMKGLTPLM